MATDLLTVATTSANEPGTASSSPKGIGNDSSGEDPSGGKTTGVNRILDAASEPSGVASYAGDCSRDIDAVAATAAAHVVSTPSVVVWAQRWQSTMRDYVQLTKPRIVVMILVTTIATAFIGAGGWFGGERLVWLLVGTGLVAASAGAANQVWERKIDRHMPRTANRPLPGQRVSLVGALLFTVGLVLAGTVLLNQMFGLIPAMVGLVTWLMYVLVYTPMKTWTSWNTTVGAIAGALPMLIGYTAVGGGIDQITGWLLVGILVAWQYPHFMAIAWMYRRQYDSAGFCMSTTVDPSGRSAGWQSVAGSIALIVCGGILCFLPGGWWLALLGSLAVAVCVWPMLRASVNFLRQPDDGHARRLLRSSLLVLPEVLAIVTICQFI